MSGDIVLVGVGARTHVGLTALETTTATRAGLCFPRACRFVDRTGESFGVCRLQALSDNLVGVARLVALGAPALAEAIEDFEAARKGKGQAAQLRPPALFLSAADDRQPGYDTSTFGKELLQSLAEVSGVTLDLRQSAVVSRGRAGGGAVFEAALAALRSGRVDVAIVGGLDSLYEPRLLEYFDAQLRIHGPATENGFLPGEAAAFVVLTKRGRTRRQLAAVWGLEQQEEPRNWLASVEQPCQGIALTMAFEKAFGALSRDKQAGWLLSDVTDERHRIDELMLAEQRSHLRFTAEREHTRPLLTLGECGAAALPLLAVLAAVSFEIGAARSSLAALVAASDGPERVVLIVGSESSSIVRGSTR